MIHMVKITLVSFIIAASSAAFAREFQTINPALDGEFLQALGMYQVGQEIPKRFNLLIVGQDNGPTDKKSRRAKLGSRADILMVLSIDTVTTEMDILSIYRDTPVTQGCIDKLGRTPSYTEKVNGVYSVGGRKQFIPCLEGMLEERIRGNPELDGLLDDNGNFEINAFFEGTRNYTIRPVAKQSLATVLDNKFTFATTYGVSALGAAMDVLWAGSDIQKVLNAEEKIEIKDSDVDSKYLSIELKERYAYRAGGYQRAFNFATVIANVLGWAAYGIAQHESYNHEFLGHYFGATINNTFSRSIDFNELEKNVFMRDNDHLLKHACYVNDTSPIRIFQWVENDPRTYAVYENGEFRVSRRGTILNKLKYVAILPNPPSCE